MDPRILSALVCLFLCASVYNPLFTIWSYIRPVQDHACVPDLVVDVVTLNRLFEDFRLDLSRSKAPGTVFTRLVTDIQRPYTLHIAHLQNQLSDLRAEREQTITEYERKLATEQDRRLTDLQEQRQLFMAQNEQLLAVIRKSSNTDRKSGPSSITPPHGWITDIEIHYDNDVGHSIHDRIPELTRSANDVNSGFGGDYVWLVPSYTSDPSRAMTSVQIDIRRVSANGRQDMARGAGGDYRYLRFRFDLGKKKIYQVSLLRLGDVIDGLPPGYDGHSGDINEGRGGDYLYLVWKSAEVAN